MLRAYTGENKDSLEPNDMDFIKKWDKILPRHKQVHKEIIVGQVIALMRQLNGPKRHQVCGTDGWRPRELARLPVFYHRFSLVQ